MNRQNEFPLVPDWLSHFIIVRAKRLYFRERNGMSSILTTGRTLEKSATLLGVITAEVSAENTGASPFLR
jgi:hypothetical protein